MSGGAIVGGVAVVVILGILVYFGFQNLAQAKALGNVVHPSRLGMFSGRAVTLVGRPQSLYRGSDPFRERYLWFKKEYQEKRVDYSSDNNRERWVTVKTETADYGLELELSDGTMISVTNDPSEVYGTESNTQGGGWGSDYRVVTTSLPRVPMLTVCGELRMTGSGNSRIVSGDKVGLIFTPEDPATRAKWEYIKGMACLTLGPALVLGVAWYLTSKFGAF
ncbi:MAG TPA: hypothetical protein DEA08_22470 [Planctomycetes bacterium]|nr:hypothetical protein [Planctomycetota bacterium]